MALQHEDLAKTATAGGPRAADDVLDIRSTPTPTPAAATREAVSPLLPLLERVAEALNSTLELREVFSLLAQATMDATAADNCSLLLLEGKHLVPALGIGVRKDERRSAFRGIRLIELGDYRKLFVDSRVVPVEDARESDLIPATWVEQFSLRAMVLVPLLAGSEPLGLMVVDWSQPRSFDPELLALLETIAAFAGVAVRNAGLFQSVARRAELQDALARAAAALAAPAIEPDLIAARLLDSYAELFGARRCALGFSDANRKLITTTLEWNGGQYVPGATDTATVPKPMVSRFREEWHDRKGIVEFRNEPWLGEFLGENWAALDWFLMVPLVVQGHSRGAVLLGFDDSVTLDAAERAAAEALAAMAAAAIERRDLVDRLALQVRQLDALHRVIAGLSEATDAAAIVARLNEILDGHGIEVLGVAFRDKTLARRLGGDRPTTEERASWRSDKKVVMLGGDTVGITMRQGRGVVGTLRVRPAALDDAQLAFLDALGRGVADVASRDALRAAVVESDRERALSAERDRIAADLHDTTGQVFVALGLLARSHVEQLPPGSEHARRAARLAELAEQGKWQMVEALRALTFVPAGPRELPESLRGLLRSFEFDSGIDVGLTVSGAATRLTAATERALYRVAHEALTNAWRHAHCTRISVVLAFSAGEAALTVTDNGVGRLPVPVEGGHFGIAGLRRLMGAVGGELRLEDAPESGLCVSAWVPREPR